ncbi:MAG: hypothetical protein WAM92_13535 [Mycobacterium sp.]
MNTATGHVATSRRVRRGLVAAVAVVASLAAANACDTNSTARHAQRPGAAVLNPATVEDLLHAITSAGLRAPNPRDVTSAECPQLGCTKKVVTDTISIIKFPSPGTAEMYAGEVPDRFQVTDVVVGFPPDMPPDQRTAYEGAVTRAIA